MNSVKKGDIITKQGHTFEWTQRHLKPNELLPMRQIGDDPADEVAFGLRKLAPCDRQCLDLLYTRHADVAASAPIPGDAAQLPEDYLQVGCMKVQPKFLKKGYTQLRRVVAAAWLATLGFGPLATPSSITVTAGQDAFTLEVQHEEKQLTASIPRRLAVACQELLATAGQDPQWLDRARLAEGQSFYREHTLGCNLGLLHLSLIGGFGAPLINRVLASTGYLVGRRGGASSSEGGDAPPPTSANGKVIATRLFETSAMVHTCMLPGALEPGACGWEHSLAVRLLHAAVRVRLDPPQLPAGATDAPQQPSADAKPLSCPFSGVASSTPVEGGWDREAWGVPINQEDLVVTSMAFSYIVLAAMELMQMWQPKDLFPECMTRRVRPLSVEEEGEFATFRQQLPPAAFQRHSEGTLRSKFVQYTSFLHLWRYIAFLMGVQDSNLPVDSIVGAKAITESLVCHLVHPDATSGLLADSIITGMSDVRPAYIPRPFLAALTWRLQGPLLAATMRVPWVPGVRKQLMVQDTPSLGDIKSNSTIFDSSVFGWLLWTATESRLLLVRVLTLASQMPMVGPWMRRAQMAAILGFLDHSLNDSKAHDYSLSVDASVSRQQALLSQAAQGHRDDTGPSGLAQQAHLIMYYVGMFMPMQLRYYFGSHGWRCVMMALLAALATSAVWLALEACCAS